MTTTNTAAASDARDRQAFYLDAMGDKKNHGALALELAFLRSKVDSLAAPAQPVAHVSQETFNDDGTSDIIIPALPIGMPLYAAPQPPTSAEPTQPAAWKMDKDTFQFLSDVMTAAGLVEHGKQCKALAKRLNSGVMAVRETFQARWAPDPDQKIVKVDCGDYYQWQAAPAQAVTAKQSPHPEYDKGFSDGWNRCEARQAAAPAQAGEYPPSSADMVMAALDTGEWCLERMQHWHCLTDEGNREGAWLVKRQKAPYCAVYTDKPGAPYGPRSWSGPTALDALQKAADDLGIRLPQPAARGAAQAAPVDAAVKPAINVGTIGHVGSGRTTLTAALGKLIAAQKGSHD